MQSISNAGKKITSQNRLNPIKKRLQTSLLVSTNKKSDIKLPNIHEHKQIVNMLKR